jgi:Protein of unknown function (DUF1329)
MRKSIYLGALAVALAASFAAVPALAAVSTEEAAKLKSTLTPLGAERAGNAAGTIPAWDGGYTTVPASYKSGDPRPDFFANEKPVIQITKANMAQHADKLTEGDKALLEKHSSYRIDVYPTHRTASAPQWVYDNTYQNALNATTTNDGLSLKGAYGGIPFPIPKSGNELIWNHELAWEGGATTFRFATWTVTDAGNVVLSSKATNIQQYPYYYQNGSVKAFDGTAYMVDNVTTDPPFRAGEVILYRDPTDYAGGQRQAWQYLTGQRRVRRAPTIGFDTPNQEASGVSNFDEIFVFNGSPERYDWKIIGKQELYVPYNCNRLLGSPHEAIFKNGPAHINPDLLRWELHRVWVVDGTLKAGKRHVIPHRRFYLDEDTWTILLGDGWDANGKLWKHYYGLPLLAPDIPAVINLTHVYNNVQTGAWGIAAVFEIAPGAQVRPIPAKDDSYFTPDALAARGVR